MQISAVSATFFCFFPDFGAGLGCCLGNFYGFSYFFSAFFRILGGVWGAVSEISAVSATFFCFFPDFWAGLGCCFGDFCGFSYFFLLFSGFLGGFGVLFGEFLRFQLHKTRFLCYQPMAIVHYDNLKIQHFLNKKTKKSEFSEKIKIITAQDS